MYDPTAMKLVYERELIVEYGKKLINSGLTKGTGGNLSVYDRAAGLCAISPSGIHYHEMGTEDVVVVDTNGDIVEGTQSPSSEIAMHTIFYREREDVRSVIHTHSPFATTLACMNWEMPAHHYIVALAGHSVRCAPYRTFATTELAEVALEYMDDGRKAVFLQNHGMLSCGASMEEAFYIAEEIEFTAEVYWRCRAVGTPTVLPDEEVRKLTEKFKGYAPLHDKRDRYTDYRKNNPHMPRGIR